MDIIFTPAWNDNLFGGWPGDGEEKPESFTESLEFEATMDDTIGEAATVWEATKSLEFGATTDDTIGEAAATRHMT